jgi:hypothetical protein
MIDKIFGFHHIQRFVRLLIASFMEKGLIEGNIGMCVEVVSLRQWLGEDGDGDGVGDAAFVSTAVG